MSGGIGADGSLTVYGDGEFEDELPGGGGESFDIRVIVDGFRTSLF